MHRRSVQRPDLLLSLRFVLMACLLTWGWGWAQAASGGVLPVPALSARVIDQTAALSADERARLNERLQALEAKRGSQVVVLMVPTTQPEDIAAYAWRVADEWKIGRREVGDGVLVLVALNDRAMRIEVARALEGAIPDLEARRIIDQEMAPAFREGRFAQGLERAVARIDARIGGEALPAPDSKAQGGGHSPDDLGLFMLIGVPVLGAVLSSVVGRKVAAALTATGAGALTWWFTRNLLFSAGAALVAGLVVASMGGGGRGGGGGGRSGGPWGGLPPGRWGGRGGGRSGGGFSSGRGGSFGGGGASGRW